MGRSIQIAFQLDHESLAEVDRLAGGEFASRAQVIRTAVHEWLARRREAQIDAALAAGYGAEPVGTEVGDWADLSVEGLEAGALDW